MPNIQLLVVAGGGAGGTGVSSAYEAGGGGAGGVVYDSAYAINPGSYSIVVGSGVSNANGQNSTFNGTGVVAIGGGKGASGSGVVGSNGGSGGGGTHSSSAGGSGTTGQGYNGGAGGASRGGGGGGSGEAGNTDGQGHGGDGSSAYSSLLSACGAGVNVSGTYYIAGGGGAYNGITGGLGGGGTSTTTLNGAVSGGTANTGSGGAGSYSSNGSVAGGTGGSGIVIVRYLTTDFGTCSGGTAYTDGIYTIRKFTSSGTLVLGEKPNDSRSAKVTGKLTDNSERSATLLGGVGSDRSAKLTGRPYDERSARLSGCAVAVGSRSCRLVGKSISATIPSGIIFIWTGTNDTIPTGWERVTSLDTKFPKGTESSTNPNTTGGNATHSHTVGSSHTHTITAHTHTLTLGGASGGNVDSGSDSSGSGARNGHGHASLSSGAVANPSISSITPSYGSVSNNPPYKKVIYITPSTNQTVIPDGVVSLIDNTGFSNNGGIYIGFYLADGNNGTTDLRNKYLLGADASGDAGGTGGSATNIHALTHGTAHTVAHSHASATTGYATTRNASTSGTDMAPYAHTHTPTPGNYSTSTTDSPNLTTAETVEPGYKKLLAIQNKSGSGKDPIMGLIGMWLGTLSSIPTGWSHYTAMAEYHLKVANDTSEIGNTGGSNSHTHASQGHTHTIGSHSHTTPNVSGGNTVRHDGNSSGGVSSHSHTVTCGTATLSLASADTSAESSSNEPEYRTVAFIKLDSVETTVASDRSAKLTGIPTTLYTNESRASLPTDDTPLFHTFTSQEMTDVATDDDVFVNLYSTGGYAMYLFRVLNEDETLSTFGINLKLKACTATTESTVYLQVYNRTTPGWETIDTESSVGSGIEFALGGTIADNLDDYYDSNYIVSIRVYQEVI